MEKQRNAEKGSQDMQRGIVLTDPIYDRMITELYTGNYARGSSLPTLEELCSLYHVGRNTMRMVLSRLAENGYIRSSRGRAAEVVFICKIPGTGRSICGIFSCAGKRFWMYSIPSPFFSLPSWAPVSMPARKRSCPFFPAGRPAFWRSPPKTRFFPFQIC